MCAFSLTFYFVSPTVVHPGNIMVDVNHNDAQKGAYGENGRITLVDAGMVAKLSQEESDNFIGLLSSIGEGDGRDAGRFVLRFAVEQTLTEEEQKAFIHDMGVLFEERCRGYGTNVDVGSVLRGVLAIIRTHRVRIDPNFATLVINILCLESMSQQVCPSYNLLDFARPLLQSYRNICYNDDGTPKPRKHRAKWINSWLALMYLQKTRAEKVFFRQQERLQPSAKMVRELV